MRRLIPVLILISSSASAQTYDCAGEAPHWSLRFDETSARMVFPAPTDMDVKLVTPVEGGDWPKAYTLIGARDTAIVLLEQEVCGAKNLRAHVLTQRAETPILLGGCCSTTEATQ